MRAATPTTLSAFAAPVAESGMEPGATPALVGARL